MKRIMMVLAAAAAISGVYAQDVNAVAEPEAASQDLCTIEESEVAKRIREYLESKGWTEGPNVKQDGSKFFVATGTGIIAAPRKHSGYLDSRVNAFNKAMLEAKKAMVQYLGTEIATETSLDVAEGAAANPPPPTEAQEVGSKLKSFLYAKLNKALASEGIDPIKDPAKAKEAAGKILNSESYKKMISTMAQARVIGFQAVSTFEGTPSNDKGEIGVIAIWSDKLQKMANSMITRVELPSTKAKRPIIQQISTDPKVLLSSFGVQQKIDENGKLILVAFGQGGAMSPSKRSIKNAQNKAMQNAMAALREFAGEQVAVASDTMNAETAEEFENGMESYANESSAKERIKAVAGRMNISGITPIKQLAVKHPLTGGVVAICVSTWSPGQSKMADDMKRKMATPPVAGQNIVAPAVNRRPSVPTASAHSGTGNEADDDAF